MTVIEVTGQDIIDALNYGISEYPNPVGKFPHVAGLNFKIAKKDNKNVATNIQIRKTAIDPAKTYKLAKTDFMALVAMAMKCSRARTCGPPTAL